MKICAHIKPLAWDSAFFARRIAQLWISDDAPLLAPSSLAGFDLIQGKIEAGDYAAFDGLCRLGFQVVEAEIDLRAGSLSPVDAAPEIRVAVDSDIAALRAIAAQVFVTSRFRSPWFAAGEAGRLYAQWVENAVRGIFDHACLVAQDAEGCAGFVTLRRLTGQQARLGLLAVAPGRSGRGIGRSLVQAAVGWCVKERIDTLRSATQFSNVKALGLHLQHGFRVDTCSHWLYKATS